MNKYLSDEDLILLQTYINSYSDDEDQCVSLGIPIEKYFSEWESSKSRFLFKAFNNQLIHKQEVRIETPPEKLRLDIKNLLLDGTWVDTVRDPIIRMLEYTLLDGRRWDLVSRDEPAYKMARFIIEVKWNILMDVDTFVENRCPVSFSYVDKARHINISITKGQKPFRAINALLKACEPICEAEYINELGEDFFMRLRFSIEKHRILHSQLLNRAVLKGTLCLSIHPMDYLTMSDNACDWDTCMTWTRIDPYGAPEPGDYRLGTVEMMNSPLVVVAYLESKEPYYPIRGLNQTWSNKKWRNLFIVHRNIITGIRGYPYEAEELDKIIIRQLAVMAEDAGYPAYKATIQNDKNLMVGNYPCWFETSDMYNDASRYIKRGVASSEPDGTDFDVVDSCYIINYSGTPLCVSCGKPFERMEEERQKLNCEECEGGVRCSECHTLLYTEEDDDYFDIDGECYCQSCSSQCSICGADYPIAKLESIYILMEMVETGKEVFDWYEVDEECFEKLEPYLVLTTDNPSAQPIWRVTSKIPTALLGDLPQELIETYGYKYSPSCYKIKDPALESEKEKS